LALPAGAALAEARPQVLASFPARAGAYQLAELVDQGMPVQQSTACHVVPWQHAGRPGPGPDSHAHS